MTGNYFDSGFEKKKASSQYSRLFYGFDTNNKLTPLTKCG